MKLPPNSPIHHPAVQALFEGLVADTVVSGGTVEKGRQEAAEAIRKQTGISVQDLLTPGALGHASDNLDPAKIPNLTVGEVKRKARAYLDAALEYFQCSTDMLRNHTGGILAKSLAEPLLLAKAREASLAPDLAPADRDFLVAAYLDLHKRG